MWTAASTNRQSDGWPQNPNWGEHQRRPQAPRLSGRHCMSLNDAIKPPRNSHFIPMSTPKLWPPARRQYSNGSKENQRGSVQMNANSQSAPPLVGRDVWGPVVGRQSGGRIRFFQSGSGRSGEHESNTWCLAASGPVGTCWTGGLINVGISCSLTRAQRQSSLC